MTEEEFRRSLRLGLGRALQFAQQTKPLPYRQALLDACVENQAYSPEHGTLAWLAWELIQESGEVDLYRAHVRQSLAGHGDDYHADKRFALAGHFAQDDDQEMREAMYENFRPGPRHGGSLAYYFIHLDGLRGLVFAARQIGAAMKESPEKWDVGSAMFSAEEHLGEEARDRVLRETAQGDADIARFLAVHEQNEARASPRDTLPASFAELAERFAVDPTGSRFLARRWGKKASDEELAKSASALTEAVDPAWQGWLLEIFGDRPYPLDPASLFQLTESEDQRVSHSAMFALEQMTHPAVREFALRLGDLKSGPWHWAAGLLEKNFEPGDHARILGWLQETKDEERIHGLTLAIWKLLREHPDPATAPAMAAYIYEYNPCVFCRETAVEQIIALGNLAPEVASECAFDGYSDIRDLVAGRKREDE